ncbi:MAG: acyl-CoA thioesterase [Bacillota bacterium]|uniref:Acyl-CoA thioesterase n=1 Tax=Virgibacillus salarius TaxID=447199 RepID=A0A941DVL3_9BACI|nr:MULTISPECIES: thioesterase family protein [Bacillaceae]NAZ08875.1 YbgC/FadM family acyl-CoA thioesterase [Agaribacter marinus]MBR7796167.1 acyl-CoA thioesterase [Virgibacillus salarius]MCC2249679.1 acyl-CoA thioesterase [Virgibacillus sp. AGTR]MDY7042670.1 thioesterase family protein [Virgibacillus sp. M23]QRZ17125.1 acyl-CoA thioesterase [Virgibacillus sp. AGTR]
MQSVRTPIAVRYQETDQMGVVYHANYLVWFEIGRTKFIESLGFHYTDMEEHQIVSPVTNATIQFKKPIRYGEDAFVKTWLETYDGIRTVYGYQILNHKEEVAVSGTTEHVIVKKDTFRPLSLRKAFPDWHEAYTKQLNEE